MPTPEDESKERSYRELREARTVPESAQRPMYVGIFALLIAGGALFGGWGGVVLAVPLVVAGALFLRAGLRTYGRAMNDNAAFLARAERVQGTVVDKYTAYEDEDRPDTHWVVVEFTLAERTHRFRQQLPLILSPTEPTPSEADDGLLFAKLHPVRTATIAVDPRAPEQARLDPAWMAQMLGRQAGSSSSTS